MKQKSVVLVIGALGAIGVISLFMRGNPESLSSFLKPWWIYILLGFSIYDMIKRKISIYNIAITFFAITYVGRTVGWIPDLFKRSYVLVIIIILFGINIMMKKEKGHTEGRNEQMEKSQDESYISVFSQREIVIDDKIVDGTHLFSLFAELTYDASRAKFEEDVIIEVTSIFASVKLYIPEDVKVILKGTPVFGEIKDKRKKPDHSRNGPTVTVRVLCLFGDVKLR